MTTDPFPPGGRASQAGASGLAWPPQDDLSRRTWLPTPVSEMPADEFTAPFDAFLRSLSGRLRPLACWYGGTAQLQASRPFTGGRVQAGGQRWECAVHSSPVNEDGTALDLRFSFRLPAGAAPSAGVALAVDFSDWSPDNYVLAPAALYNGNRYRVLPVGYPPYIYDPPDRPLDMPVTVTNIPHLNTSGAPGRVELLTGSCATPLLSFFAPGARRGFILLTDQGTRFGNSGLFVEEEPSQRRASFVVSAPGVREQRYVMCGRADSGDAAADWNAGDEVSLRLRLYNFAAPDIPAFLDKIFDVRKALSGSTQYRHITPFTAAAGMIASHHDRTKWLEEDGYAYICNRPHTDNPFDHLQVGWGGVPVYSYPQAILETPERLRRVRLSFDTVAQNMQGKSGLLYGIFRRGELIGDNFNEWMKRRSIAMIRRDGETLYFGLKQNLLLKARGHADMVKPAWDTMLRRVADGLLRLWNEYGQLGQTVNVETGRIEINGSSAGTACVSGLALASHYFSDPRYLAAAEAVATLYYDRDLSSGYVGGGPAEILQCPDSESAYNLVEAFVVLYELTGTPQWLTCARTAASLLSTWVVSYDYVFPKGCDLERVGARATGSVWASVQNAHSAPGLYVSSGDFLLKLFRATGDRRIAGMYQDTVHNVIQYVNTPTNPVGIGSGPGVVTERVNLSDWEGREGVGAIPGGDSNQAWETLALLACLENPGIYLRTDDDTLIVLDHMEARVAGTDARRGAKTLEITNPTLYDARVSILAEGRLQAAKPLGWTAFDRWPQVEVKAGATVRVEATSDGTVVA